MSGFRPVLAMLILLLGLFALGCGKEAVREEAPPVICPEVSAPAPEREEPKAVETKPVPQVKEETAGLIFVARYYADIAASDIPAEIASLLPAARKAAGGTDAAMAHLKLAWLYGYYKNPSPLYGRALQELDAYLSLHTADEDAEVLKNWRRLLRELVSAHRENGELREKVQTLGSQLEQLKHLDIEMEKTRKMMK